jgi:hypothetical protein
MSEDRTKTIGELTLAQPPAGGRQDHEVMREAAMLAVDGPASTSTLAAGGGLEVPGREPRPAATIARELRPGSSAAARVHEPIPGERDASTLTHREAGSMGGQFTGADTPPPRPWLDDRTAFEHALEGGGDDAARRHHAEKPEAK